MGKYDVHTYSPPLNISYIIIFNLDRGIYDSQILTSLFDVAVETSNLYVLNKLKGVVRRPAYNNYVTAIRFGQVSALEWLISNGISLKDELMTITVMHGQINIANWLEDKGYVVKKSYVYIALIHERVSMLQWLEIRGYIPDSDHVHVAVCRGSIPVLEWLEKRDMLSEYRKDKHYPMDDTRVRQWFIDHNLNVR